MNEIAPVFQPIDPPDGRRWARWFLRSCAGEWRTNVYFVLCEGPLFPIKIGIAENLKSRMSGLQVSSPYTLRKLCSVWLPARAEGLLHLKFRHLHMRGEWFRGEPELQDFIAGLKLVCDAEDYVNQELELLTGVS